MHKSSGFVYSDLITSEFLQPDTSNEAWFWQALFIFLKQRVFCTCRVYGMSMASNLGSFAALSLGQTQRLWRSQPAQHQSRVLEAMMMTGGITGWGKHLQVQCGERLWNSACCSHRKGRSCACQGIGLQLRKKKALRWGGSGRNICPLLVQAYTSVSVKCLAWVPTVAWEFTAHCLAWLGVPCLKDNLDIASGFRATCGEGAWQSLLRLVSPCLKSIQAFLTCGVLKTCVWRHLSVVHFSSNWKGAEELSSVAVCRHCLHVSVLASPPFSKKIVSVLQTNKCTVTLFNQHILSSPQPLSLPTFFSGFILLRKENYFNLGLLYLLFFFFLCSA